MNTRHDVTRTLQHKISQPLHETRHENLLDSLDERHRAQNLSNTGDVYGFTALPTCTELTLENSLYTICLARRLLLRLTTCNCEAHLCPICHSTESHIDPWGDHACVCTADANPNRRTEFHDKSYVVFYNMLRSVGFHCTSDHTGGATNALISDSQKRPDIILHDVNPTGSDILIDCVTCVPTKRAIRTRASNIRGAAADEGHARIVKDWYDHCVSQGDICYPLAIEDGGLIHDNGLELIDKAVAATGGTRGEQSAFRTYWRQRISIAIMRGVAKMIKSRIPRCAGEHQHIIPMHHCSLTSFTSPPAPHTCMTTCHTYSKTSHNNSA